MNINGSVLVGEDRCLERWDNINPLSPSVSSDQALSSNKTENCKIEDSKAAAVSKWLAIGTPLDVHESASNYAAVTAQKEARRNELVSVFECRAEDQNMIASMRKAIAEFQPRGFVFFDFNLSPIYKNTLAISVSQI